MAVLRFDNGVLAQLHDAFTVKHAGTGLEVHGTEGSIIARDVMTQRPVRRGRAAHRERRAVVPVEHENLYARALAAFNAAVRGRGPARRPPARMACARWRLRRWRSRGSQCAHRASVGRVSAIAVSLWSPYAR